MNNNRFPVGFPVYRRAGLLKAGAFFITGLLLASCAGTPSPELAGEECVYVKVTGSNLPIKECTTPAQRQAMADASQDAVQNSFRDFQGLDENGDQSFGAASLESE